MCGRQICAFICIICCVLVSDQYILRQLVATLGRPKKTKSWNLHVRAHESHYMDPMELTCKISAL